MGESGKSEICFHSTNQQLVSALFEERYFMHQNVYHHHEVKGVEMLVADAIAAANPVLHFSEMACR
jgi:HD superfamily phosphohydrolase